MSKGYPSTCSLHEKEGKVNRKRIQQQNGFFFFKLPVVKDLKNLKSKKRNLKKSVNISYPNILAPIVNSISGKCNINDISDHIPLFLRIILTAIVFMN